jgi:hypothetical protein
LRIEELLVGLSRCIDDELGCVYDGLGNVLPVVGLQGEQGHETEGFTLLFK